MERKINGYSVSIQWKTTPDGVTVFKKDVLYMPDENTEITNSQGNTEGQLRDLTEKELNEIMYELENKEVEDRYPLKTIRAAALKR